MALENTFVALELRKEAVPSAHSAVSFRPASKLVCVCNFFSCLELFLNRADCFSLTTLLPAVKRQSNGSRTIVLARLTD